MQVDVSPDAALPALHFEQVVSDFMISPTGHPEHISSLCVVHPVPDAGVPPDEHLHIFCLQLRCPISF